jgi:hypothetical protein
MEQQQLTYVAARCQRDGIVDARVAEVRAPSPFRGRVLRVVQQEVDVLDEFHHRLVVRTPSLWPGADRQRPVIGDVRHRPCAGWPERWRR